MTGLLLVDKELEIALDLARKTGEILLQHFGNPVHAEKKNDGTPVTELDRRCEELIREVLHENFPEDDIWGEEQGKSFVSFGQEATRRWLIDPIDGTYNFMRGIPIFSTLISLVSNGEVLLGVISAPAVGDLFFARKGFGAFKNGIPLKVSSVDTLSEAHFLFGEPDRILANGFQSGLERIIKLTRRHRSFCDYLNFAYVFEGKAEATMEVAVEPWDLAPMKIIVEEAGGRFTDVYGRPDIYAGNCIVSNGLLHNEILNLLTPVQRLY